MLLFGALMNGIFLLAQPAESLNDSIIIQIDSKLGKVVQHQVTDHQTLYAISRLYGVWEDKIRELNPKLLVSDRHLPSMLKIPIADEQLHYRIPLFGKDQFKPVYYEVASKDNLFRISRVFFDIPTNLLISRNQLEDQSIKEGDLLHLGWIKTSNDPLTIYDGTLLDESVIDQEMARQFNQQHILMKEKNEVAYWKKDADSRGYFVMHRHAPVQSIIEIVNPLFSKTIYARVIGKIPDNMYSGEIDMVLSTEAAKELQAIDHKFFVRVRYPADQQSVSR